LAALADNSFEIDLSASEANGTLKVDAEITATENLGELNLTIHTVVIENVIKDIVSKYNETNFESVVKAMLPNALGTSINDIDWKTGTREYVTLDYNYENVFDKYEIRVVMFIQDEDSKEVYQVEMANPYIITAIDDKPVSNQSEEIKFYPNPASIEASVFLGTLNGSENYIEISDNTGRLIQKEELYNGQKQHTIDVSTFDQGIYTVRIISDNMVIGVGKLLVINHE
jgi:hypothetical protein